MNTRRVPLAKKRKVEETKSGFGKSPKTELIDCDAASQQQLDSSKLIEKPPSPPGPPVSKMELSLEDSQSTGSCSSSEEDLNAEDIMHVYREECKLWLLDNGKAFFHVEALSFLRDQNRKQSTVGGGFRAPRTLNK